ncbi:hypothetical protein C499_08722 [Halogeometricum borinquense DSM 11551]|uniref:Ig-like domain repeat protein n=1 Tax=Halogeometricum borinquense (strain ATCC 700274 / DSM 11551 / JCM 10706 / KCTC 4070 / PR3) TaxID=469382 RepID=E4NME4_HALBP|nr:Ig-like domain repeat protein [Halogeometricum borinquense]ADQ68442.1 hypothetical protein Hbor_29030 [Halogeometricum borinquense DSM 11551]ELY27914.1 hypothetical protein C499_08722 [Halogeometricum borinquense DSM 11551]
MIRDRLEDARRPAIVAFALFATYLVVSTAPVAAASSGDLAVGSSHTTASDFNDATELTNVSVEGSGTSASVALEGQLNQTVDGFEDGDLSEYTQTTGDTVQSSMVWSGDYAVEMDPSVDEDLVSTSGLPKYPSAGDTISFRTYHDGSGGGWAFNFGKDSNNYYRVRHGYTVQDIRIIKVVNGTSTTLRDKDIGTPSGEWVRGKIEWGENGELNYTVYDEAGNVVASLSATDSNETVKSGGIMMEAWKHNAQYFDAIDLNGEKSSGTYISQPHDVGNAKKAWADLTLQNASATVTIQAYDSSTSSWTDVESSTYSSTGNYTLDLGNTSYEMWRTKVVFDDEPAGTVAEIHDEGVWFQPRAPSIDGAEAAPSGGSDTNNEDVTLSVPISDSDFSTPQGDSVTVDVYLDGEIVDTQTITSNQTVSTTVTELEDGNHTWHVETTDEYGEATTSSTWNFTVNHYAADVDNSSASPDGSTSRYANETISIDVSDRDFAEPSGDEVKVDLVLDGAVAGSKNVTKNGTVTFDVGPLEDGNHTWHVEMTDEYGLTSESDSFTWEIDHYEPTVNSSSMSPEDGAKLTSKDVTLSVNVSDRDFQLDGDTVTAEFVVDSEVVGTDTLSANGTASTTITDVGGGNHSWYVRVYDEYGSGNSSNPDATSANKTYLVPSTLYIRPVNQPKELINGTNVTVTGRFFSGELVFERSTENGKLNLTDLPVDRTYVLVLEADGHNRRTVIITSLYEQDSVYLLNDSKTAYYTEFVLNDLTGEFSGSNERAKLYIERAVNTSSGLEWVTVSGDFFGAEGRFEATLEKDRRYRIRIVGEHNSSRVLGAYTATRKGTVTLNVGQVSWKVEDNTQAIRHSAAYIDLTDGNEEPNGVVHFQYHDPTQNTSKLRVIIHAANNSSNEIMNSTYTEGYGTFSLNKTVSGNLTETDWEVTWYAYNSSNTVIESSNDLADGKRYVIENPIGPKWTPVILTCLFLFVGMLFGGRLSSIGSLAVTGVAAVMWWLGWYTASGGVVVFAGLVAVAMAVGGGGRR